MFISGVNDTGEKREKSELMSAFLQGLSIGIGNFQAEKSARCLLLKDEDFCYVDVLYGRLGISKLLFLIKKIKIKIQL